MQTEQPEGNIRDLKDLKDIQRACCKRYPSQPGGPQRGAGRSPGDKLCSFVYCAPEIPLVALGPLWGDASTPWFTSCLYFYRVSLQCIFTVHFYSAFYSVFLPGIFTVYFYGAFLQCIFTVHFTVYFIVHFYSVFLPCNLNIFLHRSHFCRTNGISPPY